MVPEDDLAFFQAARIEATESIIDVGGVARSSKLAVVGDVNTDFDLFGDDFGHAVRTASSNST